MARAAYSGAGSVAVLGGAGLVLLDPKNEGALGSELLGGVVAEFAPKEVCGKMPEEVAFGPPHDGAADSSPGTCTSGVAPQSAGAPGGGVGGLLLRCE